MSGPSRHPDADTLADLDAGGLDGSPAEATVRGHVEGCESCAEQLALLQDTRSLLAGLPAVAVPVEVAARISAALAAESAGGPTVLPAPRQPARRSWTRPAAVAAGLAIVLSAGAGIGALATRGGSAGGMKSSRGSAESSAQSAVPEPAWQDSGRNYTAATLDGYVRGLLPAASGAGAAAGPSPSAAATGSPAQSRLPAPDPALARLHQPAMLQACVDELSGSAGTTPVAVDFARYQGRPAAVIVLPGPDPAKVAAWVVGPGCRPGQADLLRYQVVRRAG